MSKIFKDKKLFGKFNIIDLLIIVCIIAIGIFVYIFFNGKTYNLTTLNQTESNFTIQLQRVGKGIYNKINIGDKIYDNETNTYIGEVVAKEQKEYREIVSNYEESKYEYALNERYININIQLKNSLQDKGDSLVTSDDYKIKVGKEVYLRGNDYAGSGYIILIGR